MPRTSRGAITLFDVTDGSNPITAFLTNENHTFAATQTGVVSAATRRMFSSVVNAFVGGTNATFQFDLSTTPGSTGATANRFNIVSVSASGTGWVAAFNNTAAAATFDTVSRQPGEIFLTAIPEGTDSTSVVTVSFVVSNELGTISNVLTLQITLSVVAQGAGGVVINLDPTSQFFTSNSAGVLDAAQTAITADVLAQGSTGNQTVSTSQNGAGFVDVTTTSNAAGGIAGWDDDIDGDFQTGTIGSSIRRLQISQTNLGDANNTLSIRVTGDAGGNDVFTIAKVRDGVEGADAIIVVLRTDVGGTVFRTSGGTTPTDKVISLQVFDAADGSEISGAQLTNYSWFRGDGTVPVRVTSSTARDVIASGGVVASGAAFVDITVGSTDVVAEEAFTCEVTTAS